MTSGDSERDRQQVEDGCDPSLCARDQRDGGKTQ
ncbi:hypothetical protein ACP4OV_008735 [Aristida adscensionis]